MTSTARDMLGRGALTSVAEAREILLKQMSGQKVDVEHVPLLDGVDRILAEDIISQEPLPSWPRSTMDGYAVVAADTFGASSSMPAYLNITGEVLMGTQPEGSVLRGQCYKIPTGGLLPVGADAVVMHENSVPVDETLVEIIKDVGPGTAVMQKGEDVQSGQLILGKGQQLHPHDLGLLAGLGMSTIPVYRKPKVAVISTGDEIVPHTKAPSPGQIRDINAIALGGLVKKHGGTFVHEGIVTDTKEAFFPVLQKSVEENDIVLFSGGSSVGMRDLGEQAIDELGDPGVLVHGVTLKPGKPVIIGLHGTTPVFGLPGHPVSALVCFETFVVAVMRLLQGLDTQKVSPGKRVRATVSRNLNSAPGRMDVVRVRLQGEFPSFIAEPIIGKSGSISTLAEADGYFIIDEASQGIYKDTEIEVILYQ